MTVADAEEFQDGMHRDPFTSDRGLAITDIRMDGDPSL